MSKTTVGTRPVDDPVRGSRADVENRAGSVVVDVIVVVELGVELGVSDATVALVFVVGLLGRIAGASASVVEVGAATVERFVTLRPLNDPAAFPVASAISFPVEGVCPTVTVSPAYTVDPSDKVMTDPLRERDETVLGESPTMMEKSAATGAESAFTNDAEPTNAMFSSYVNSSESPAVPTSDDCNIGAMRSRVELFVTACDVRFAASLPAASSTGLLPGFTYDTTTVAPALTGDANVNVTVDELADEAETVVGLPSTVTT
jgi:hypothetical protein